MPPTGRPGSMPAKRSTAAPASWRSCLTVHVHERLEEHLGEVLGREVAHAAPTRLALHALGRVEIERPVAVALDRPRRPPRAARSRRRTRCRTRAGGGGASPAWRRGRPGTCPAPPARCARPPASRRGSRSSRPAARRHAARARSPGGRRARRSERPRAGTPARSERVTRCRHRVEQLGGVERHARYGAPEGSGAPSICSSLRALAMSDWYFSRTCSVSPMIAGSISFLPR